MQKNDKRARDLQRIEAAQRRAHEQLLRQQVRVNKRFEKMREHLANKYGEPSDSQQRIVNAALELLSEDGLNNLSLRKLAARVNMQAPALYWHFSSKEVLVDYMAEAILGREFQELRPRLADSPWQAWLIQQMLRLRQAMLAFPDGARVVAGAHLQPAVTLGNLFECVLESLESSGMDGQTARHILMTASTYTFGFVIEEQASPNPEEIDMLKLDAFQTPYPHIAKVMKEAHRNHRDLDHDYKVGLDYIIKGAAASAAN